VIEQISRCRHAGLAFKAVSTAITRAAGRRHYDRRRVVAINLIVISYVLLHPRIRPRPGGAPVMADVALGHQSVRALSIGLGLLLVLMGRRLCLALSYSATRRMETNYEITLQPARLASPYEGLNELGRDIFSR